MLVNSNIYNLLGSSHIPVKRNRTHKASELKAVYNSMARYNRQSPRYILSLSQAKQSQIIGIKEAAMTLREIADSLSKRDSEIYEKSLIVSSDESYVTGALKPGSHDSLPDELTVQVDSLATGQINTGLYLYSDRLSIRPGTYNLDIATIAGSYKTNFTISSGDNNLDIEQRIQQCINNAHIGLKCSLVTQGDKCSIRIASTESGSPATEDGLFFSFEGDPQMIDILGLNNVTTFPANSQFRINGELLSSSSNHISINQSIELDFHKAGSTEISLTLTPDTADCLSRIEEFANAYNSLLDIWQANSSPELGCRNLFTDISVIALHHRQGLEEAGLNVDDNGRLSYDTTTVKSRIEDGSLFRLFLNDSSLTTDIHQSTERLTIDPIAYVNKLIVTYPDAAKKPGSVYNKALYSGLLYNNYA